MVNYYFPIVGLTFLISSAIMFIWLYKRFKQYQKRSPKPAAVIIDLKDFRGSVTNTLPDIKFWQSKKIIEKIGLSYNDFLEELKLAQAGDHLWYNDYYLKLWRRSDQDANVYFSITTDSPRLKSNNYYTFSADNSNTHSPHYTQRHYHHNILLKDYYDITISFWDVLKAEGNAIFSVAIILSFIAGLSYIAW